MTQIRKPSPFATEATAPQMGVIRICLLMWKLQARRVRTLAA